MQSFGDALNLARKRNSLTLRQLAMKVGLSIGYLSDIEQGRRRPPREAAVAELEKALATGVGALAATATMARHRSPMSLARKLVQLPCLCEVLASATEDLTEEEMEEALSYLNNIRNRRR